MTIPAPAAALISADVPRDELRSYVRHLRPLAIALAATPYGAGAREVIARLESARRIRVGIDGAIALDLTIIDRKSR